MYVCNYSSGCTFPLGMENSQISDSQLTSSSNSNNPSRGRLYADSSWCSVTTSSSEYVQVDLIRVTTVTGVALQGNPSAEKWVTSFIMSYSYSVNQWYNYTDGQVTKVRRIPGN